MSAQAEIDGAQKPANVAQLPPIVYTQLPPGVWGVPPVCYTIYCLTLQRPFDPLHPFEEDEVEERWIREDERRYDQISMREQARRDRWVSNGSDVESVNH